MARFYGSVEGMRGKVSRLGGIGAGMTTVCASWSGAVQCHAYNHDGNDYVRIRFRPWKGHGNDFEIYDGPIEGIPALVDTPTLKIEARRRLDGHKGVYFESDLDYVKNNISAAVLLLEAARSK